MHYGIVPNNVVQIAHFRKDPIFSAGNYLVYDLITGPPPGWTWIIVNGTLRTMPSTMLKATP